MFKTVLALALLLVVKVLASPLHSRPTSLYEVPDKRVIQQEAACAVQGGMCREREECDPGEIVRVADLCPQQSSFGIVCCYYQ